MTGFLDLLATYPAWARIAFVVLVFAIVLVLVFARRDPPSTLPGPVDPKVGKSARDGKEIENPPGAKDSDAAQEASKNLQTIPGTAAEVVDSPGTTVFQAGGDITVSKEPTKEIDRIKTILVEARLTCTLEEGAELPPSEVPFLPVGDAHSYLEGAAGKAKLSFVSPVRFRMIDGGKVVVINRFSLDPGSIDGRPVEAIFNYESLLVPIVTVVYGKSLSRITLLEVTVEMNGESIGYGSWKYDVPFQKSPSFSVPIDSLSLRLDGL